MKSPTWPGLRPTSDRLRETLFDVLSDRVSGATVLDGFAGTGALGIEAISRGAAHVTFADSDPRALRLIATNLALCGIESGYAIIRSDLDLPGALPDAPLFDVILLDPPYSDRCQPGGRLERAGRWLAPGGVLVFEHGRRHPVPESATSLVRTRDLVAGDSALAFYRHRSP